MKTAPDSGAQTADKMPATRWKFCSRGAGGLQELTKLHEEFCCGRLSEIVASIEAKPFKGEMALLIEGRMP